jgi:hypothetical protein
LCSWACETFVCGFMNGATPASLVEGVDFYSVRGESGEEDAIHIA